MALVHYRISSRTCQVKCVKRSKCEETEIGPDGLPNGQPDRKKRKKNGEEVESSGESDESDDFQMALMANDFVTLPDHVAIKRLIIIDTYSTSIVPVFI